MKQKILYILMMITALLGGNGEAWAQTENYVLEHPDQIEIYSTTTLSDYNSRPLPLKGPGATLTFEAQGTGGLTGNSTDNFYVQTSIDGNSWKDLGAALDIKHKSWTPFTLNIEDNVKYIRFIAKKGSKYYKQIKKIYITRATTLSTSTSLIDFGNVTKRTTSDEKYAVVHFENTNYNQNVTGQCDDTSFEITQTPVGATSYTGTWTGSDYKSTNPANIPITFKPTRLGTHDGKVTLTMDGVTTTFRVIGTGTTTYYGKAVATNSEGGNAYVTFDSNTASSTTTSQVTTNKVSSETSTSSTAYYRAVPHDGYEFVGWTLGESGEYLPNTSFSTEISYSSEDSNAPSETIYKAWFRPIYYFSATAVCIYNHGNVEATVEDTQKSEGPFVTNAIFTAQPKKGCTFKGWYTDINHTQCVSKELTCTETITNTEPCSTANLTLYAWFKCNQALSWKNDIQDFNLVQGTTVDCSATSDKGLKVFYRSSNPDVASVGENGLVTGNAPSNNKVTITAYQEGNDEYNAAPLLTRSFYVQQKLQPVFEVSGFTGNAPTLKVGETATITLSNVDSDFTFSSSDNTVVGITRNGDVLTLTALKAGVAKVILSQPANATHNASTAEYNITVERHQGGLTVSLPETMKVGDTLKDFWNTSNSEVPVAVESSNPNVLSYADGTISAVGEGTAVITVKQAETDKWAGESRQQTITVSKVANTLGISLASLETKVGSGIAVSLLNQNNTETPVIATITEQVLSSEVNNGTDVITYADGIITAKNAGTAKITFSQSASVKYTAFTSSTYEITVTKTPNPITVSLNGGNALSINLKYGATATLAYSSVHSDTQIEVSRTSGNYTTLSGNTITAGNAAGTDIYEVKQQETHKYEEGYAMFSIRVNNTNEEVGYVLYDDKVYAHDIGGVIHTYDKLSGPGEILYYSADRVTGAIYYHLYAEYSIDGSSWIVAHDNTNIGTSYKDFSCAIPETARYVRFRNADGGTLNKHVKNVKVPRKTYVRASADNTDLGTVYTGSTAQATFTVDYSTTNGGNIHVNSSNPNFTVSSEELAVSAHSDGTKTFKVTYTPNPNQLGEESALITISDLFYTQEITLKATAAKRDNTLKVVGEQNLKVGDVVDNVYTDKNSDAELTVSISSEGVVNFDATSNRLTAIGEGSAIVTLFQNANDNYHGITKTISVNVSKIANTLGIAIEKDNLKVGEKTPVNFTNKNSDGAITASYAVDGIVEYRNGEIVALKAGTTRITLTQAATVSHTSVSQSFDMTVTKHDQTVQWDNDLSDNDLELNVGQTLETNTATASSGLSVTYSSSNPAALSVDPTTGQLTAISSGVNIIITATQAGNDMYNAVSITRSFNVISKMEATVITSLSASGTNELRIGGASVTIGCVTTISMENFTITGEDGIVATAFENNTLSITPLKKGSVTITLQKDEDDSYYAIDQTYEIDVLGAIANLAPGDAPVFEYKEYDEITLNRTLSAGHSTLTLPFGTEIRAISNDSEAYAAQLALVTYNKADGYTLYFQKVAEGQMVANQPYVVYLPNKIENPTWKNVTVVTPNAESIEVSNWTMQGNYTPGLSMSGKYGIAGGEFCLGTEKSSINAYTAYFTFLRTENVRTRVAVMDGGGNTTYIGELSDLNGNAPEEVFGIDGMRLPEMKKGINIVRQKDGSVRKIVK